MKMLASQQHKQQSAKEKKAAKRACKFFCPLLALKIYRALFFIKFFFFTYIFCGTDAAAARDVSERQAEQNSLFLLRHLDQADTLDVFELLLCKANYGLKVRSIW